VGRRIDTLEHAGAGEEQRPVQTDVVHVVVGCARAIQATIG
jgi:hypothetical protein